MNKSLTAFLAISLAAFGVSAKKVHIPTKNTSLVLEATEGQPLKFLYYGNALSDNDVQTLDAAGTFNRDAYPVYGMNPMNEAAFSAVHADGNMTLDMAVTDVSTALGADNSTVTTVTMADKV